MSGATSEPEVNQFACSEPDSRPRTTIRQKMYLIWKPCVDKVGNREKVYLKDPQTIRQDVAESFVANIVGV
jgi:hypothetical protein